MGGYAFVSKGFHGALLSFGQLPFEKFVNWAEIGKKALANLHYNWRSIWNFPLIVHCVPSELRLVRTNLRRVRQSSTCVTRCTQRFLRFTAVIDKTLKTIFFHSTKICFHKMEGFFESTLHGRTYSITNEYCRKFIWSVAFVV